MPLALPPGAPPFLPAQVTPIVHPATAPAATPMRGDAVVVQADDGFAIVSGTPEPQPSRPAAVALGSSVRIDPALLPAGSCQTGSDHR